ncbi:MAG: acetyl-CoA carboxylase carboxyltransferase subunit beta [Nitrospirae bacterium]|nr:MAG: acetyl-CoA carboxylase carboxyltransferase subunit beta [Nitrospirota bacterium]
MAWFVRRKIKRRNGEPSGSKGGKELWLKCANCKEILYRKEIVRNLMVCPKCQYHFRISAAERIALLIDDGTFEERFAELASTDPLRFRDTQPYTERLKKAQEASGLKEAAVCGVGELSGWPVAIAVLDFRFMAGSMGTVVGEKVTRTAELAREERRPLLVCSTSGGARMQESIFSLMQMAKTSAAIARLGEAGVPYISILTDPTFGGVTASFSMLGDIHLAEPRALIGFAGPRVIQQTIRAELPEGFQRAEFLRDHGMVDQVVERARLKEVVHRYLRCFGVRPAAAQAPA